MKKKEYKEKGFVRNKYLEDLGLAPWEYGTNFLDSSDSRSKKWKEERDKYGFDQRETWCLDEMFYEWLYSRLCMYEETASKTINLSFHKFKYTPTGATEPITVTQIEAIHIVKDEAKRMILQDDWDDHYRPFDENIMILFNNILPSLWW